MEPITEELIELIRQHKILYDLSHPEYKSNRTKNKIWDEIGSVLKINGDEAKKRWKNIRDCYAKHLRSEKTCTGQKATNINRYKSWPWAAQMSGFKPFFHFAPTTSNVQATSKVNDNVDTPKSQEENQTIETETLREEFLIENSSDAGPSRSAINNEERPNISPCQPSKKTAPKRKCREEKKESSVAEVLSYLKNESKSSENSTYDELDLLFLGHAKSIKKLSAKYHVIAKYRVAQVIMEEELKCLEETTATSSLPSFSSRTNYIGPSANLYQRSDTYETRSEFPDSSPATSPHLRSDNSRTCHSGAATWYQDFSQTHL